MAYDPKSIDPVQKNTLSLVARLILCLHANMTRTLYVLYNANGNAFGKLSYGYKKLTSSSDKPLCAACDLTHGGLRLEENEAWKNAKTQIEKEGGLEVKQLHRDELGAEASPLSFLQIRWGSIFA